MFVKFVFVLRRERPVGQVNYPQIRQDVVNARQRHRMRRGEDVYVFN